MSPPPSVAQFPVALQRSGFAYFGVLATSLFTGPLPSQPARKPRVVRQPSSSQCATCVVPAGTPVEYQFFPPSVVSYPLFFPSTPSPSFPANAALVTCSGTLSSLVCVPFT